jgi:glucokinase
MPSPESPITPTLSEPGALLGLDIGGTKCAVSRLVDGGVREEVRIPTGAFAETFVTLCDGLARWIKPDSIVGISCGGPLDATKGIILSPPNLATSWHGVEICRLLREQFGARAILMNDANACALAEWQFGAGRGTQHMVFLTSGTGMGAGLILNGQLYEGVTGDAGEVGHLRLASDGPVGFGKAGSFEGFCSGGGIARLADQMVWIRGGEPPAWYSGNGNTTTKQIADAAKAGDSLALEVMTTAGERLGEALSVIIDLFNPERVVIGGFFKHIRDLVTPAMQRGLQREALPHAAAACQILPAELGETIGSHGAIAIALQARRKH